MKNAANSSKKSLLKRMICFKPQNSEENPLILLNNSKNISKPTSATNTLLNSNKPRLFNRQGEEEVMIYDGQPQQQQQNQQEPEQQTPYFDYISQTPNSYYYGPLGVNTSPSVIQNMAFPYSSGGAMNPNMPGAYASTPQTAPPSYMVSIKELFKNLKTF